MTAQLTNPKEDNKSVLLELDNQLLRKRLELIIVSDSRKDLQMEDLLGQVEELKAALINE